MKIQSITTMARAWTDKTSGTPYFTAIILVNGEVALRLPFSSGYGNQSEFEAFDKLEAAKIIKDRIHHDNGFREAPWCYCERKGIKYFATVARVANKKDL